jgi:hypothetical protein
MPLVQIAIARGIQRPEDEVSVAFQELDGQNLQVVTYDAARRQAAGETAQVLASRVASELRRAVT